jgi:hypothetical protein
MTTHLRMKSRIKSKSKSHCDWRSISQKVLVSSPIWGSWPDIYYRLTVMVLFLCGALSDERTSLSFVYAAGPCQRILSRVRVFWYSRSYFTVSDMRLPFSSPPTTRRVTVEVFDPASTRLVTLWFLQAYPLPRIRVLASRCLAMDYSGFHASYHSIMKTVISLCVQ